MPPCCCPIEGTGLEMAGVVVVDVPAGCDVMVDVVEEEETETQIAIDNVDGPEIVSGNNIGRWYRLRSCSHSCCCSNCCCC